MAETTDNTIWIDVRTAEEYTAGFYKDSINIPYDIIHEKIAAITEEKSADIRVYCRTGRRSGVAKDILNKMGYSNVVNEGGYEDLRKR
ncbi:rhodanese-like domain-containing protein [Teredinibacter haidensis]|uniref:rhodanese-like domain-containing protein n=1 Tax=Teredinibacter haidensis TaxID=2731755 RepID=UPI000948FDF8|nr:rhodanese-like domain-containing protein [Teredinibacter haidensis]